MFLFQNIDGQKETVGSIENLTWFLCLLCKEFHYLLLEQVHFLYYKEIEVTKRGSQMSGKVYLLL